MHNRFETNALQYGICNISCKLGNPIPKGIIVYYPLVYSLNSDFLEKSFLPTSYFFLSQKNKLAKCTFLSSLASLVVLYPLTESFEVHFTRLVTRLVRLQKLSLTPHYGQKKLSRPPTQNSENFAINIVDQKPP
jgi:hypothetical protein